MAERDMKISGPWGILELLVHATLDTSTTQQ